MKNKQSLIILLLALCSCNLNLAPENVMVDQLVYSEPKTAQAALMGAYVRMNVFAAGAPEDQNNYSYPSYCWMAGDLGTENAKARPDGMASYIALEDGVYDNSVRDGSILSTWNKGYNAIDYANNIIDGIARYGKPELPENKRIIAEAKFLRAFVYFNLLKMFGDGALTGSGDGLGLILRDKPYDGYNPNQVQSRATVSTTWDFIISDLEDALRDLPEESGAAAGRFRASKPVAQALLSRIWLYRGSYTNDPDALARSAGYSREVLGCSDYVFETAANAHRRSLFPSNEYDGTLASSYPDPSARSSEIIFYQPSRISTDLYPNGTSSQYFTKRTLYVESSFPSTAYLPGDFRGIVPGSPDSMLGQGSTNYYISDITTLKYTNNEGYDDVIYIRLSEIKLNLAEAIARTDGITDEALGHLNDIRRRPFAESDKPAALKASDFSGKEAFIDAILEERGRELAFESHRRWDLIRSGKPLRNASLTDAQKILPIPDYEVNISKGKIEQNTAFR
ncbi:MAG: RagB/SusD family nutrient uptake outer membrane protein [Bacteroidales bacterium]|nr:RagB/SusD family nutrient uptake outer membrane protein [Bacteroidales bacterium]